MTDQLNGDPVRILLIEDNPGDALLLKESLKSSELRRFELAQKDDLATGLKSLADEHFDVVLLDLVLPDGRGIETVRRTLQAAPETPVIVLTGFNDESVAANAVRNGAQDYLVKGEGDGRQVARSIIYAIERKRAEVRLAFLAYHDALTGLANRKLFLDRLESALSRAGRTKQLVGLLFADLDGFKAINDSYGHDVGDAVLKAVADRLAAVVRKTDTVARLGGDEFAVVMENVSQTQDVAIVTEKILHAARQRLSVNGRDLPISASIGVSIYPSCGEEADQLLKCADMAMYGVKEYGGDGYQFFKPAPDGESLGGVLPERSLRQALENNEFVLFY